MKKTFCLLIPFLSLLLITSCDKNDNPMKVVMLAHGTTFSDQAFLESCKSGLVEATKDFGLVSDYDIDTTAGAYLKRLDYFGDCGYDLIIAVGYMWNDAVIAAARKYPGTDFILVDATVSESLPNVESIVFDVDEAAYPLGYLSAWWAYHQDAGDPAVGYVGALAADPVRQLTEPFLSGVNRFNQQYGTSVSSYGGYVGSFVDSVKGGQMADSLMNLGADIIFGVGGQTGDGALLKAYERHRWGIGVDVDQSISIPVLSATLLSSAMKRLDHAIYAVVQSKVDNKFSGGGVYTGNLANDGVQMAPYHGFASQIPDSIVQAIDQIRSGIISGSISTGWK